MNKIFKVIWSTHLGVWVAVSELAKGQTKGSNGAVGETALEQQDAQKQSSGAIFNYKALSFAVLTLISPSLVFAETGVGGGTGSGTAISNASSTTCGTQATTGIGSRTIAIGCDSVADGNNSGLVDRNNPYNTATSNGRVNFGTSLSANLSVGTGAYSGGTYTDVDGISQAVSQATAIGSWASAKNVAAVAIGSAALATGNTSLSIGRQSAATADYAQALGNVAAATGVGALAIGHSATATGYRGIAIGSPDIASAPVIAGQQGAGYQTVGQTKAAGRDAIALGGGSQSLKDEGVSIGAFSGATEQGSAVIGVRGAALGQQSLTIGTGATTVKSGTNIAIDLTTSLGAGAQTNK